MAHFAKVIDGTVDQVIVAEPEFFNDFVDSSPGQWIQTSYNTLGGVHYDPETKEPSADQSKALRKNYAGIGYLFDGVGFYAPQPYPSWTKNADTYLWEAPTPMPVEEGKRFTWDEPTLAWVEQE